MSTKVRKQIYLEQRQNRQLKRLAEARGVSEAAVIRELIDAQAAGSAGSAISPLPPDRAAWEDFVRFARARAWSGVTGVPYKWNREEIYEERLGRFGPLQSDSNEDGLAVGETPAPDAAEK